MKNVLCVNVTDSITTILNNLNGSQYYNGLPKPHKFKKKYIITYTLQSSEYNIILMMKRLGIPLNLFLHYF